MMNLRHALLSLGLCVGAALLYSCVATADVGPARPRHPIAPVQPPSDGNRDPVALARRDPAISQVMNQLRSKGDETAVQVTLGEQCGFAGCGRTTLVAFTYKSRGANTQVETVLALVS